MAQLHRAVASLRFAGDDLIPSELTRLLGAEPTSAREKGQNISRKPGIVHSAKSGQWRLHATETEPEDLDGQVAELLGKLTNDLEIWKGLASRFRIDLLCGWYMAEWNEGVTIAPKTLKALGDRGIELALDIYGHNNADS
jgi:hypothetical protein